MNQPPFLGGCAPSQPLRTHPPVSGVRGPAPAQTPNPGSLSLPLGADGAAPPHSPLGNPTRRAFPGRKDLPAPPVAPPPAGFRLPLPPPGPRPRPAATNVRDVGFVDLETEPYHLYFYLPDSLPPDTRTVIRETAARTLRDANVTVELIDLARGNTPPGPDPPPGASDRSRSQGRTHRRPRLSRPPEPAAPNRPPDAGLRPGVRRRPRPDARGSRRIPTPAAHSGPRHPGPSGRFLLIEGNRLPGQPTRAHHSRQGHRGNPCAHEVVAPNRSPNPPPW
jgi:hypothetical protein